MLILKRNFKKLSTVLRSLCFIILPFILPLQSAWGAPTFATAEGYIPRATEFDTVYLNFVIKTVDAKDIVASDLKKTLFQRLAFKLPDVKDSNGESHADLRIKYAEETTSETTLNNYSLSFETSPTQEAGDNSTYIITFAVKIYYNGTGPDEPDSIKTMYTAASNKFKVAVSWKDNASQTASQNVEVTQKTQVANEAPSLEEPVPIHLGATVSWTKADKIAYSTGDPAAPAGSIVYFIDGGLSNDAEISYELAANNYDADISKETTTTCTLTINQTSCTLCDTPNIYLDHGKIATEEWAKDGVISKGSDADTASTQSLVKGHRYAVFSNYLPDGLARSACFVVTPTENMSLSELYGADEAKEQYPGCFIATAAYGTPFHKNLKTLRWFRNNYLLTNPAGRTFVHYYYRWSPDAAQFIGHHPVLKALVRGALWVPVKFIEGLQQFPVFMETALVLFIIMFVAYSLRRRLIGR